MTALDYGLNFQLIHRHCKDGMDLMEQFTKRAEEIRAAANNSPRAHRLGIKAKTYAGMVLTELQFGFILMHENADETSGLPQNKFASSEFNRPLYGAVFLYCTLCGTILALSPRFTSSTEYTALCIVSSKA